MASDYKENIAMLDWASKNRDNPDAKEIQKILKVDDEDLDVWKATDDPSVAMSDAAQAREIIAKKVGYKPESKATASMPESGIYGFSQAATFGFGDEIAAGINSLIDVGAGRKDSLESAYEENIAKERMRNQRAMESNPKTYIGGMLAGSIMGSKVGVGKALTPVAGASLGSNLGKATAAGALMGAGTSENKIGSAGFAGDVALGGGVGLLTQGALEGASKLYNTFKPSALKSFAEQRAVRAAGANKPAAAKMELEGVLHERGRRLLDEKIVTATKGVGEIAKDLENVRSVTGQKLGALVEKVDDTVKTAKNMIDNDQLFNFLPRDNAALQKIGAEGSPTKEMAKKYIDETFQGSGKSIASRFRSEILSALGDNPNADSIASSVSKLADKYDDIGSRSLSKVWEWKKTAGQDIPWTRETSKLRDEVKKKMYFIINDEMEKVLGKIGNLEEAILGGPVVAEQAAAKSAQALGEFKKLNADYAFAKPMSTIAKKASGGAAGLRVVGPLDFLAGVAGSATGNSTEEKIKNAALSAAGSMLARRVGSGTLAVGADKLADILISAPQSLGRFADVLAGAAQKGQTTLIATHAALMEKDPDYKKLIDEQQQKDLMLMPRRK